MSHPRSHHSVCKGNLGKSFLIKYYKGGKFYTGGSNLHKLHFYINVCNNS